MRMVGCASVTAGTRGRRGSGICSTVSRGYVCPAGTHATNAARTSARAGMACPFSVHSTRPAALTTRWSMCWVKSSRTLESMAEAALLL